jgi:hypothetical protein
MRHLKKHTKSKKRGGNNHAPSSTVNYRDAQNWMFDTVGSGNTQYDNVFSQNSPFPGTHGNAIVGLQGQIAGKTKKRRGGNLAQVINQAIVPFGILGLQQSFKKKRGGRRRRKTRRHR